MYRLATCFWVSDCTHSTGFVGCAKNSHKYDEMPKNFPSRYVTEHCSDNAKIRCLGAAGSLGGHSGKKDKHTIVSGIIRSRVRREARCIIEQQLLEDEV